MDIIVVTADSPLGATLARSLRKRAMTVDIARSSELARRMLTSSLHHAVIIDGGSVPDATAFADELDTPQAEAAVILMAGQAADVDDLVARIAAASGDGRGA